MLLLDQELDNEYQRWIIILGPNDPYTGQRTVGIHDVLRAHFLILDYFKSNGGEGYGGIGPKDLNLLHSALSRQQIGFNGIPKYTDGLDLCATLFFGIAKNHAFHDANKRTALLVALYHLGRLGHCASDTMNQKDLDNIAVATAENNLCDYAGYNRFHRRHGQDAPILFLSDWMRRHTRKVDHSIYTITYNDLDKILKRFGCRLANPSGNSIDVLATHEETQISLVFFTKKRVVEKRVAHIGFPGLKKQVAPGIVREVRRKCGLTPHNGVDSQVFFKGVDNMEALIDKFSGPLRRLANK